MAESDFQRTPLTYAVDRLRYHRDVYVPGNLPQWVGLPT